MRYELSSFDYIQILLRNTALDCVPHFVIHLKEEVRLLKLKTAIKDALKWHPIFATKIIHDHKYYLEDNHEEVVIEKISDNRKDFGRSTNGYPWRVTYQDNILEFDFCHVMTDGKGMARFITTILECYHDLPVTYETEPYIRAFDQMYKKGAQPLGKIDDRKGFSRRVLPHIKNGNPTSLTIFSLDTLQLLKAAKKVDSTPAAVLLPLLSKSIYRSLPINAKNKNVRAYFTADFRKATAIETGMNFIGYNYITYTKDFEKYDLEMLGTIYRSVMDLFLQKENIEYFCTDFSDKTSLVNNLKSSGLSHRFVKLAAPIEKSGTNAYLTYIGKMPFTEELSSYIEDIDFMVYPDTGYCVLAAVDFKGTMKLSLCNNYKTTKIEENLIRLLNENQIDIKQKPTTSFAQSHLVL